MCGRGDLKMAERDNTEVQSVSFVGYTGVRVAVLVCGTYKIYMLYLRQCKFLDFPKLASP